MTLLARDEEDIVAGNVEYHFSRGVDHVIAMDNRSEDRTTQILRSFERAGRLSYIFQEKDDYAQGLWVTQMARRAYYEFNADWVINSDADEFWWPEHGDLKDVLAAVPDEAQALCVERSNFVPCGRTPGGAFAEVMTVRERRSLNSIGEPLPPKVCHRGAADIVVEQGNHAVSRHGRTLATTGAPLSILHFPVRSYAQFANKIAKGGAAYERNDALPDSVGATWRRLYEQQRRGELEASFDNLAPGEAALAEGLATGALVRDLRLRDALASMAEASA